MRSAGLFQTIAAIHPFPGRTDAKRVSQRARLLGRAQPELRREPTLNMQAPRPVAQSATRTGHPRIVSGLDGTPCLAVSVVN